jgi:hypothetical protein
MLRNRFSVVKKTVAAILVLVLTVVMMPFGGILSIANAQIPSQFNINLSTINSGWGTMDASRSGPSLIFDQEGVGMATVMINITDTDMLSAVDSSTVTISSTMNGSVSGMVLPALEGEPDHTSELFVSFGTDAGEAYNATPAGSDNYISTDNGSFSLDTGNVTIPAGVRWIMIKTSVTTPAQTLTSATTTLTNSISIIADSQDPTVESSYSSNWSNQDIVVTITASDNIGTKGIYDGSDNLLTTGSSYAYTVTDEGDNISEFYAIDYAENVSETLSVNVNNIDRTLPNEITAPTYSSSWTNVPVEVTFDTLTQTPGTSPISYAVSLDGGSAYNDFAGNVYTVTTDGELTSIYKIVDEAGNESSNTVSATARYDSIDPSIDSVDVTRVSGRNDYVVSVSDVQLKATSLNTNRRLTSLALTK